jgi:hypothetical protein
MKAPFNNFPTNFIWRGIEYHQIAYRVEGNGLIVVESGMKLAAGDFTPLTETERDELAKLFMMISFQRSVTLQ